jgi:hypothetical protein
MLLEHLCAFYSGPGQPTVLSIKSHFAHDIVFYPTRGTKLALCRPKDGLEWHTTGSPWWGTMLHWPKIMPKLAHDHAQISPPYLANMQQKLGKAQEMVYRLSITVSILGNVQDHNFCPVFGLKVQLGNKTWVLLPRIWFSDDTGPG